MLKFEFLIISYGAWLKAWSDFPYFLSLADHMPDLLCIYKYTHAVYILKIFTFMYMSIFIIIEFILYINVIYK